MNDYALITGASKGIGGAMALLLAQKGYNLLLVARSSNDLENLAALVKSQYGVEATYYVADLSVAGTASQIAEWVKTLHLPVSILINNAGLGIWGNFDQLGIINQTSMMQVNMATVVELSYHLLPTLKSQKQAYILNVSSTAAYQAVPTLALYAASKSFVLSFSRALRYELRSTTVSVSCLCPGPTDTGFAHSAGMDALAELAAKFNMTADEVARIGINGMLRKKAEIVPGFLNKLSSLAAKHSPKALIEHITAGLYKQ
jgi:short-subunit dehydrogenase